MGKLENSDQIKKKVKDFDSCIGSVLHQLDQKIIYPHYDFKHLTEKYFEIGMKLDDFLIQLVKYCRLLKIVSRDLYISNNALT